MTDVHDKVTRSFNMSRIKGKNTKPELKISGAKCWRNRCQRHHMFIEEIMYAKIRLRPESHLSFL